MSGKKSRPGIGVALDGGDQGDGVAVADDDGPVGLLGELAGFETEGLSAELTFNTNACTGHPSHIAGRK